MYLRDPATLNYLGYAYTDVNGRYQFTVAEGSDVEVVAEIYRGQYLFASSRVVHAGPSVGPVCLNQADIIVPELTCLSVTILDTHGQPISAMDVYALQNGLVNPL